MVRTTFVQCIDCDRIYTARRDEENRLWTTNSRGCPQCQSTAVRDIMNYEAAGEQSPDAGSDPEESALINANS